MIWRNKRNHCIRVWESLKLFFVNKCYVNAWCCLINVHWYCEKLLEQQRQSVCVCVYECVSSSVWGLVIGACRGGNQRTWWWTAVVKEAIKLRKEAVQPWLAQIGKAGWWFPWWVMSPGVYMLFVAYNHVSLGVLWGYYRSIGYQLKAPCKKQSESCVHNHTKSMCPVSVGLCQGCPLSPILFVIFMDSRCSKSHL